jgi:N-acetylglucosamine repressor
MIIRTMNQGEARRTNRSIIIRKIFEQGPLSRRELARRTGLTAATAGKFVEELINGGLVVEAGADTSTKRLGGPIPVLVNLAPGPPFVFGVHIGVTVLGVGLFNLRSETLDLDLKDIRRDWDGPSILARVAESIRRIARRRGIALEREVLGVGIGVGGVVDSESGHLSWHKSRLLRQLPIKTLLEEKLKLPVFVGNIVQAMALAEAQFGSGRTVENFLYLYVGGIVGCAQVNRGEILSGARNIAGQISHLIVQEDGPVCTCGRAGCLEALVTREAILRRARDLQTRGKRPGLPGKPTMETLTRAALAGDPDGRRLLEDRGTYLGKVIADLVNLLDPQKVIVAFGVPAGPAARKTPPAAAQPLLTGSTDLLSPIESRCLTEAFSRYIISPENIPPIAGIRVSREMQVAGSASPVIKNVLSPMLDLARPARVPVVASLKQR